MRACTLNFEIDLKLKGEVTGNLRFFGVIMRCKTNTFVLAFYGIGRNYSSQIERVTGRVITGKLNSRDPVLSQRPF